ncbi:MAG: hypothetical protein RL545_159, partial [Actinomycetota bacterium]
MQKRNKVVLSSLASLGLAMSLGLLPAQALSLNPTPRTVAPQAAVLRHTNHFLVTNIVGQAGDHSASVTWDAPAGIY